MASLLLATFAAMLYVATRRVDLIVGGAALFGRRGVVRRRSLSVRDRALCGVARSVRRPARARLSGAARPLFARRRRLVRHGIRSRPSRLHPGRRERITSSLRGAKSSARSAASCSPARCCSSSCAPCTSRRRSPTCMPNCSRAGLAATLGFQVFIIIGGVLGLFPLTGITLPFFSYGGSSLVANFLLVALVWAISNERIRRTQPVEPPRPLRRSAALRARSPS